MMSEAERAQSEEHHETHVSAWCAQCQKPEGERGLEWA